MVAVKSRSYDEASSDVFEIVILWVIGYLHEVTVKRIVEESLIREAGAVLEERRVAGGIGDLESVLGEFVLLVDRHSARLPI